MKFKMGTSFCFDLMFKCLIGCVALKFGRQVPHGPSCIGTLRLNPWETFNRLLII